MNCLENSSDLRVEVAVVVMVAVTLAAMVLVWVTVSRPPTAFDSLDEDVPATNTVTVCNCVYVDVEIAV
jgi:hypothetical protein